MRSGARLQLSFFVSAVLLGACGIPTTEFLGPPDATATAYQANPPNVTFPHNTLDNSTDNFLGYELYYKFYAYSTDPNEGQFGDDYGVISTAAPGRGKITVEERGFHRIRKSLDSATPEESNQPPLIAVDQADKTIAFQVVITFPDKPSASSPVPASVRAEVISTGDPVGEEIFIIRARDASAIEQPLTFESDDISIDPPDADVPAGILTRATPLHMVLVILAFGTDYTGGTFQTLYSDPLMIENPLEIFLQ